MRRRDGVTKVEVLLVAVILLLLAGLILPAIARVREDAARQRSTNNLKQLALACHNYCDAFKGRMPLLTDQGPGAPTGTGLPSLFFTLVPYIESGEFYAWYDQSVPSTYYAHSSVTFPSTGKKGYGGSAHAGGVANLIRPWYVSPADDSTLKALNDVPAPLPAGTGYYATTSYAANGLVFGPGDLKFPDSFKDGTANTIFFAERPQVCRTADGQTVYNLWGYGTYGPQTPAFALLTPDEPAGLNSTGLIAQVTPLPTKPTAELLPVRIGRASAVPEPPPASVPFQVVRRGRPCDPRVPRTPHATGMLVALADGSVRTVAPTVSPYTFWAACTPAGGEELGKDW
jgi:hypothetical protein